MNNDITFWETLQGGMFFMIPLALLLIASIWIFCNRYAKVSSEGKKPLELMQRVTDYVMEGDLENAKNICEVSANSGSRVLARGVSRIGYPISDVAEAMQEACSIEKNGMEKGRRWLKNISVVSPLLGAAGTLIGITVALNDISVNLTDVDLSVFCNHIAPTLVTVICGLGVGILTLVALTCLDGKIAWGQRQLERLCIDFLDLLNEPT